MKDREEEKQYFKDKKRERIEKNKDKVQREALQRMAKASAKLKDFYGGSRLILLQ